MRKSVSILQPGTMVAGVYRIDGTVGRGGMGAVYEATHQNGGQKVALKVLLKNFTTSSQDERRFEREAKLVKRLKHPNIVELYDVGHTDRGQPYIAFELLKGTPLGTLMSQKGPLPLEQVIRISRDVLAGLAAAHDLSIIHRDMKPQNIFVQENGSTKILDFGIAKAVKTNKSNNTTQLTEAGQMLGTPQYMSPEQVRSTDVMPCTDVYSIGLLMAEMISGQKVIQAEAMIDAFMIHVNDAPFDFDDAVLQSPLANVIQRATQKKPNDRFPDANSMLAAMPTGPGQPPEPADNHDFDPLNATVVMADANKLQDYLNAAEKAAEKAAPANQPEEFGAATMVLPDAEYEKQMQLVHQSYAQPEPAPAPPIPPAPSPPAPASSSLPRRLEDWELAANVDTGQQGDRSIVFGILLVVLALGLIGAASWFLF